MEPSSLALRQVSLDAGKCNTVAKSVYPVKCLNACEGMGKGGEETGKGGSGGSWTLTEQSSLAVKAKVSSCEKSTDVTVFECPCPPNHTGVVTPLCRGEERQ
jgi:hypothetical protein